MKIFVQLAIIFLICMTGDAVSSLLPFTFPGSIVAMLILFALFCMRILSPEKLDPAGSWLQRNMAFFFLPSNILIMKEFELISHVWLQILIICVVSTVVTFTAATFAASGVMKLQDYIRSRAAGVSTAGTTVGTAEGTDTSDSTEDSNGNA